MFARMADALPYALLALVLGLVAGWLIAQRAVAAARGERDAEAAQFRRAIADLAAAALAASEREHAP